jgi:hypothetical protein
VGLALAPATSCADTNLLFGVHKGRLYLQTNDEEPVLALNNAWFFGGDVDPKNSGLVSDAAVVSPLGNTNTLYWSDFMEMFGTNMYFSSQANLDSAYPAGQYYIDVRGGVTQRSPITLPPDDYPAPLRIANLSAAQRIRPDLDFSPTWDAGVFTNLADRVRLYILDSQRQPVFVNRHDDYVSAPATSVTIPAHTLAAGRDYNAFLIFIHVVWAAQDADPKVVRDASYYAFTQFKLSTLPRFVEIGAATNGCARLRVEASTSHPCIVEVSTNLSGWLEVSTNALPTNVFDLYDCSPPANGPRFYRLKVSQ